MQRKKIIAGNWKMNKISEEANTFIDTLLELLKDKPTNSEIWLAVPFPFIERLTYKTKNQTIKIGAQNCSEFAEGAYTGETSAAMLQSISTSFCLSGHSERREYYFETDTQIHNKIQAISNHNMIPVYCCGESLEQRKGNLHLQIIQQQLSQALLTLELSIIKKIVIAYEPVWAIGTGLTASPQEAQEIHLFIRKFIENNFGYEISEKMRILYGGSVKPSNAKELFSKPDIDGGLIGGASLIPEDFFGIIKAAQNP